MKTTDVQSPSLNTGMPPTMWRRPERIFVIAELVYCMAFALFGVFLLFGPDGPMDPRALIERVHTWPHWGRNVLLGAELVCLAAEFDLLGRFIAVPLARIVHGRRATPRQTARLRLVTQVAVVALIAILMAVKPDAFPRPSSGWCVVAILVVVALPICLSAVASMRKRRPDAEKLP